VSPGEDGLRRALGAALDAEIARLSPVAGGDLNDAFRAETAAGSAIFVKTAVDAPAGGYAAEARGLVWLAAAGALPVPRVLAVGDPAGASAPAPVVPGSPDAVAAADEDGPRFLALQWIAPGPDGPGTAEALGTGLAALHLAGADAHGGPDDVVRLGPLELPNAPAPDAATFLLERRLRPLTARAIERGALDPAAAALVDRLAARLPGLLDPAEPPARLHGDLWGGNVLVAADGTPWLIDPAAHGGHREVDLALLRLFGVPGGRRTLDAYAEVAPLADGAEDRVDLWQLTPLLVHAVLFGGGYGPRALQTLRRYA